MTRSVRRTAFTMLLLLGVLAGALTYQQTVAAARYRDDVRNPRAAAQRAEQPRGRIVTADGVVVAESIDDPAGTGSYLREYPQGERYAHVTGYSTPVFGDTGLEDRFDADLTSGNDGSLRSALLEVFGADLSPADIHLTIRADLQDAAAVAIGEEQGAVVALDPATGAVLALVSVPSFDPNTLIGPGALGAGAALTGDPDRPLLNRATSGSYPPGSTFKLITAAAGLAADFVTPDTRLPDTAELALPGSTSTITNFDDGFCGNGETVTLQQALAISCNTAFADLGMRLGAEAIVESAEGAGWNEAIPFDLATEESLVPEVSTLEGDLPAIAQTALGQRDVRATPLQLALVAAAVANEGVAMQPYLVDRVVAADGSETRRTEPERWRRAMSEEVAADLEQMMTAVVAEGSGWRAQIPGVPLAGKTGTAEVPGAAPDVWFVVYGPAGAAPGESQIVVAVVVEAGGAAAEDGTGGSVAAPIAAQVVAAWLGTRTQ